MFDLGNVEPSSLVLLDRVVAELSSLTGADERSLMLIGAHCRDLLHQAFGRTDTMRSTDDVDVALAVSGPAEYHRITSALPRSGATDVRYSVADIPVDVVPFGGIEHPAGTARLPGRRESIDVFGFQEVFDRSDELTLPGGSRIALPTPAGYAVLKVKAWADRSAHFEYKDASDIATLCSWYQRDPEIGKLLYSTRLDLLQRAELDTDVAALYLLSEEIAEVLGAEREAELTAALESTDLGILAHHFAKARSSSKPNTASATSELIALTDFTQGSAAFPPDRR
ncbi:hypothetical protein [Nocardia sp. NPDC057227]|uniref:hypothetical protein n=1 Tax=Nocardia sp. NPDC057227 TaxID=3346056 RepID=UPI003636DE1A